jgi:hypothetical protein
MAYTLLDAAEARWRRINGHELLVPLVRVGATFIDDKLKKGVTSPSKPRRTKGPSVPA